MNADCPAGTIQTLRVQAVFHEIDAHKAERIAAEMVARAHELANTPEWECDVDVNIESLMPDAALARNGGQSSGPESPAPADLPSATGAAAPDAR